MITLTYIWHDCFVLSTGQATIVFDYWRDPEKRAEDELPGFLSEVALDRPLYVVVSHHHKDHFTREIFEWSRHFKSIHYIISKDVAKAIRHMLRPESIYAGTRPAPESVHILTPGEVYRDGLVEIDAFGSTDIGNSYVVTVDGKRVYHSGDLNAWIWKDESTEKEVKAALKAFTDILGTIRERYTGFDIAMFPVDSRIGTGYYTGASIFVREFKVKHFFPMHFGLGDEAEQKRYQRDAGKFEEYANPEHGEYIQLAAPYSSVMFTA